MRSSLKLRSGCAERAEQKCNRRNLLEPDIEVIDDGDALGSRMKITLSYWRVSASSPAQPSCDHRSEFQYQHDRLLTQNRPDCVQIVIALVVTPEGLPLAYEVLPGNTAARTTLRPFLEHIERQYGKARRVWLMERGIPTEEVLYDAENHGELPAVLSGTRPFSILMTIH